MRSGKGEGGGGGRPINPVPPAPKEAPFANLRDRYSLKASTHRLGLPQVAERAAFKMLPPPFLITIHAAPRSRRLSRVTPLRIPTSKTSPTYGTSVSTCLSTAFGSPSTLPPYPYLSNCGLWVSSSTTAPVMHNGVHCGVHLRSPRLLPPAAYHLGYHLRVGKPRLAFGNWHTHPVHVILSGSRSHGDGGPEMRERGGPEGRGGGGEREEGWRSDHRLCGHAGGGRGELEVIETVQTLKIANRGHLLHLRHIGTHIE
ncbi:hypothetical protein FB45DRAFT_860716 [Roridomyces roridus]|uniref:Uncharacterized protein n=1 Tax=Roridomyces roridus TaxID=1738132 RepID=A0AAD7FWV8_9AGAR|nr:hypothetical protein FB45DRAFT_860716 [Roridomyces roridus]